MANILIMMKALSKARSKGEPRKYVGHIEKVKKKMMKTILGRVTALTTYILKIKILRFRTLFLSFGIARFPFAVLTVKNQKAK